MSMGANQIEFTDDGPAAYMDDSDMHAPVEHKMPAPECDEMYVKVCGAEDCGAEHAAYHEYDEEEEEYDPEHEAMLEAEEKAEKERRAAERALELVALNAIAASVAKQRSDPLWRSKELEAIRAGVV